MYLKNIRLSHFRNYRELFLELDPHFNVFVGRNAQGKTSLIEAVYYFAFLKSFRSTDKTDILTEGFSEARLQTLLMKHDLDYALDIQLEAKKRRVLINGKSPQLRFEYDDLLAVILFEPSDVYLFRQSPSHRRRYLGRSLFTMNPASLKDQTDYDKILMNKNRLLKDPYRASDELSLWNDELCRVGAKIIKNRLSWIDAIEKYLSDFYHSFSGDQKSVNLTYISSVSKESLKTMSLEDIGLLMSEKIQSRMFEEKRRCESLVGPHRDDWNFILDGQDVSSRGSQGENRTAVMALKASEGKVVEARRGTKPIFLLDDVASELDEGRISSLMKTLGQWASQVFVTSTDTVDFRPFLEQKSRSFVVEDGSVRVLQNQT